MIKMIEKVGMQHCKPCKTPSAFHLKKYCLPDGKDLSQENAQRYHTILGSLMYAMIGARPDIALVSSEFSKYVSIFCKNT